jgi:DNA-binding NtrC family response regulator
LVIEPDDTVAAMITEQVETALDADVIRADSAHHAGDRLATMHPDVVIAELDLPDGDALRFVRDLRRTPDGRCPVVLMAQNPTVGRTIEAMRLGVCDLFVKPFDIRRLAHVIEQQGTRRRRDRTVQRRNERLRKLAHQVVRQRRDLRQRVDLVCRDLVNAYQRLARKVVEQQRLHEPVD